MKARLAARGGIRAELDQPGAFARAGEFGALAVQPLNSGAAVGEFVDLEARGREVEEFLEVGDEPFGRGFDFERQLAFGESAVVQDLRDFHFRHGPRRDGVRSGVDQLGGRLHGQHDRAKLVDEVHIQSQRGQAIHRSVLRLEQQISERRLAPASPSVAARLHLIVVKGDAQDFKTFAQLLAHLFLEIVAVIDGRSAVGIVVVRSLRLVAQVFAEAACVFAFQLRGVPDGQENAKRCAVADRGVTVHAHAQFDLAQEAIVILDELANFHRRFAFADDGEGRAHVAGLEMRGKRIRARRHGFGERIEVALGGFTRQREHGLADPQQAFCARFLLARDEGEIARAEIDIEPLLVNDGCLRALLDGR